MSAGICNDCNVHPCKCIDYAEILARELGCKKVAIYDTLFPISKGFTEQERIDNVQAIYAAMRKIKNK